MVGDIYQPAVWAGFFELVGTGAAALTGLIFVSMSLNLPVITQDITHKYRAICNLAGLTSVFVVCALAIMGSQSHLAVGLEWIIVATIGAMIYIAGYTRARKDGHSTVGLSFGRLTVGVACYVVEGAYLDGIDGPRAPAEREGGTTEMLDGLTKYLTSQPVS